MKRPGAARLFHLALLFNVATTLSFRPVPTRLWIEKSDTTIVINEILAHTDEPQIDSIELYNTTATPVAVGGWFLSDNKDELDRYKVAPNVVIPAAGYQVFTADELTFGLSEFGETLYLTAPGPGGGLGLRMDQARFGVSPNGVAFGRYETSAGEVHYPLLSAVTPGTANADLLASPLIITEIMYHPATGNEYLIVTNRSSAELPLYDVLHPENRWKLNVDGEDVFEFPAGMRLAPGGAAIITGAAPGAVRNDYREPTTLEVIGPFSGKLSNEGERIALLAPQPPEADNSVAYAEMDAVTYGATTPWPTQANGGGAALLRVAPDRYADDPANWQAGLPTPEVKMTLFLPVISH